MGEDGLGLDRPGHWAHGDARWELDGDAELIDRLARSLLDGHGVVMEGQRGAGHEHLASRVLDRVSAYVRIMVLEPPLDDGAARRLAELAQELRSMPVAGATAASPRRPALPRMVFLLPQGDAAPGGVIEVLSRMVASGHACVIAVATDPRAAHDADLRRALRLMPTRIGAVPLEHARDFLARGLGAPASERAAFCVWDSGAANRSLMKLIAEDWRDSGYLHQAGGIWVVGGGEPPVGPRTASYWQDLLATMEASHRDAFEILALGGTLTLALLMRLVGADAVDGIHARGHLDVDETIGRTARLKGNTAARAIREGVSPGRGASLLQRAIDLAGGPGVPQPALVGWRLRCGLPVETAQIIDAAEFMLRTNKGPEALVLLAAVPASERDERFTTVQLGALIAAGRLHEAKSAIRLLPRESQAVDDRAAGTGGRQRHDGGSAAGTRAEAELVELVLAAWEGDFRPSLAAPSDRSDLPEHVNWLWRQSVHEARVMTGRVREGLRADRDLVLLLAQSATLPEQRERARLGLFDLEMLAGEWENARTTLEAQWYGNARPHGAGRPSPFHSGMVRAMTGRYADAVSLLRPEIPQLQAQSRCDLLPLAHAASALSLALLGDVPAARAELAAAEVPQLDGPGVWRSKWAAGFFWAQAAGLLGSHDAAIGWLMHAADEDRGRGNTSQELLSLSAAMQLGHQPAVPRLAESAQRADGRFANACRQAAIAYLQDDAGELASVAHLLHDLGQPLFAGFLDRRVATLAPRGFGRMDFPDADDMNQPAHSAGHGGVDGTSGHGWRDNAAVSERPGGAAAGQRNGVSRSTDRGAHELLTGRQLSIVEHVLRDASNRQIAARLDLSVRTVESHLYQVYSKLGVKNREALKVSLAYLWDGEGPGGTSSIETNDT